MKIYIASSWKNQHAVELLTAKLREANHQVLSFVENNYGEGHAANKPMAFEEWVYTPQAARSFNYDVNGARYSDLIIYISPSGKDAAAEVGIAWASNRVIFGLHAKGEDFGLMRHLITEWFERYDELLLAVHLFSTDEYLYPHLRHSVHQPLSFLPGTEVKDQNA